MGSGENLTNNERRPHTGGGKPPQPPRPPNEAVGTALRSVYQEAVREDVPDDLLDLLKKLD